MVLLGDNVIAWAQNRIDRREEKKKREKETKSDGRDSEIGKKII